MQKAGSGASPFADAVGACSFTARYDFFYKNGVPKWRGTGYYYSRFRPGLGVRTVHSAAEARSPLW